MPYEVTRRFEHALGEYTGAPYVVCVNSCTAALLLACEWHSETTIEIPKRTYISVPHSVVLAGHKVAWGAERFEGAYQLKPLPVWDCALRFTSRMYIHGQYQCISFAAAKILGIEQGGAILHDDPTFDVWARRMRFDGRTEGLHPSEEKDMLIGHHCLMLPSIAAQGLLRLHHMPKHNPDQVRDDYPDLSRFTVWR